MEDTALLEKHFAGASVRALSSEYRVGHETIANRIRKAKRELATELAGQVLIAKKTADEARAGCVASRERRGGGGGRSIVGGDLAAAGR